MAEALILLPKKQKPGDGYNVFSPEAKRYAEHLRDYLVEPRIVEIDANKMRGTVPLAEKRAETKKRRDQVITAFDGIKDLTTVALFCHGWRTGLQLGFDLATVKELALAIRQHSKSHTINVVLYSCSCGSAPGNDTNNGDGGFADKLRDCLCAEGLEFCTVDAHTTVGHATRNPYVRRFDGMGSRFGGTGGNWIVAPGSKLWPAWRKALRMTDLRFSYPQMGVAAIHEELSE